ncbi:adenylate cyclase [Sphingomonas sp. BN140010]|uniref:Adenylate cyclase n=1 Tax=Sphingomonas arvum TaxID=2992113 RepID=A0ABT3JGU6_9SPHN|nr:adenylate cyclase [Sphingomonas sp. BN140010]MCW3798239.1 adenylate cyclase [Sphingomonas sp. BN140010]
MATRVAARRAEGRAPARGFMADQRFFTLFAAGLAMFIVLGFAQFQLRGYANFRTAPAFLHLHGALMLSWLSLFVLQGVLISRGQVVDHRKTGWLSLGVAVAVVVVGSYTGLHAIAIGRVPPFFTPAFFLALNQLGLAAFALVVIMAVVFRRQVQWHRRLMVGSGILITEPALGRLLPMPILGQTWGELLAMAVQLGMVAVIARHDRKVLGQVHPATLTVAAVLVGTHLAVELASRLPLTATLAASIAAG